MAATDARYAFHAGCSLGETPNAGGVGGGGGGEDEDVGACGLDGGASRRSLSIRLVRLERASYGA
eukprot:4861003-Prymnesium_polylepis.1